MSTLVSKNIVVGSRRTSMRLEPAMWEAFQEIADRERQSLHNLATHINRRRGKTSLTSATRVFILMYFRRVANDAEGGSFGAGPAAGHGGPRAADELLDRVLARS